MIRHVKELSSGERNAIESILGRTLADDETVSIRPVSVIREAPPLDQKREVARELLRYLAALDAKRPQCPEEELDDAIDEALKHVRPSYKPVQ